METVLDIEAALERCEGDMELLREVAEMFREHAPEMMGELRRACGERHAAGVNRAAHMLKGAAGSIGAAAVFEVAQRLELLGAGGDVADCDALLASLEAEMSRLEVALTELA